MKVSDLISLSTKNLARRKGRTALTVIGVVVGTCAVIVMISLGLAMNKSNEEMIASYGDLTKVEVFHYGWGGGSSTKLDDAMMAAFRALPHVIAATPEQQISTTGQILAGKNRRYAGDIGSLQLYGMQGSAMEKMGYALSAGRWLNDEEKTANNKIPILVCEYSAYGFHDTRKSASSTKYMRNYYDTDDTGKPLQQPFFDINSTPLTLQLTDGASENAKTKEYQLEVVGVIKQDNTKGWWTGSGIVMRLSDMKMLQEASKKLTNDRTKTEINYNYAGIKVDDVDNVAEVDEAVQALGFKGETQCMAQTREMMQKQVAQSQMVLGGLAAISLLVAALNIANTMTMAIYERTREIGVMKVLGCELGQIRAMFLIESGCIGLIGGAVGLAFSLLISFILNNISMLAALLGSSVDLSGLMSNLSGGWGGSSSTISIVPPWLMLGALAFATCIGLLSGLAPANRAVKISALEAIRHD